MAIIKKRIRGRDYAYLCQREGTKVRHTYIGQISHSTTANDNKVLLLLEEQRRCHAIPAALYPLFWDTNPTKISLIRHSKYVIERILEIGTLDAVLWMERAFTRMKILEVLILSRRVSNKSKNFWFIWYGI